MADKKDKDLDETWKKLKPGLDKLFYETHQGGMNLGTTEYMNLYTYVAEEKTRATLEPRDCKRFTPSRHTSKCGTRQSVFMCAEKKMEECRKRGETRRGEERRGDKMILDGLQRREEGEGS